MSVDPASIPPIAAVQVTLDQIYKTVTITQERVADIAHTMNSAIGQLGDHETRIRDGEKSIITLGEKVAALEELPEENRRREKKTAEDNRERDKKIDAARRLTQIGLGVGITVSVTGSWVLTIVLASLKH